MLVRISHTDTVQNRGERYLETSNDDVEHSYPCAAVAAELSWGVIGGTGLPPESSDGVLDMNKLPLNSDTNVIGELLTAVFERCRFAVEIVFIFVIQINLWACVILEKQYKRSVFEKSIRDCNRNSQVHCYQRGFQSKNPSHTHWCLNHTSQKKAIERTWRILWRKHSDWSHQCSVSIPLNRMICCSLRSVPPPKPTDKKVSSTSRARDQHKDIKWDISRANEITSMSYRLLPCSFSRHPICRPARFVVRPRLRWN